ncbi:hypothetical protein V6N12_024034 [Hibiscus sabdariffa]|uniref:Uncharacterized protein n=1 Tax=Hibiscus sabdariffa TaxID=183260 RepID=A0ABR2FZE6_9ROSI
MDKKGKSPVTSSETGEETELKKELQGLLKVILEEDECSIDMTISSIGILSRLAEMKLNQSVGTVSRSGKEQILQWCEEHGVAPPKVDHDIDERATDQCHVNSLLEKLSSSLKDQKEAAKELHSQTKTMPSCRAVFSEIPDGISRLLNPLSVTKVDSDPELQEDLIATVLNISTVDNNKKLIAKHPVVIPLLAASMRSGTIATKRNAAAALFTISTLDSNRRIIGNSGALVPLLELLRVGHPLAMKDAVSAIFSLCQVRKNIVKFTEIGAVKVITHKLNDGILVDELLGILALLSQYQDAIDDLKDPTTFPQFIQIIRKNTSKLAQKAIDTILYNVWEVVQGLAPKLATANDFFLGLNIPKNTSNSVGSVVSPVNVDQIPGLNTLGMAYL